MTASAQGAAALATAAANAAGGITQVATAGASVASGVAQAGVASTAAATGIAAVGTASTASAASMGVFAAAIAAVRASMSGFVSSLANMASQIEINRQSIRAFSSTAKLLSIPTGGFTGFISVLSRIGNLVGTGGAIAIGIAAVGAALVRLGTNALEAQKQIESMAAGLGTSFAKVAAGREAFEKLGGSAKQFQSIYEKVIERVVSKSAELANKVAKSADKAAAAIDKVAEARMKLAEAQAQVAGGDEAAKAAREQNEHARAVLAVNEAYRNLGAAIREQSATAANSLGPVLEKVEQMAQGFKGIKFDAGTEIKTVLDAVDVALGKAISRGEGFQKTLFEIIAAAPKLQAMEIGKAFDVPESVINKLQKGKQSISEIITELEKAKATEFKPNLDGINLMKDAFSQLKETWSNFMTVLGESNIAGAFAVAAAAIIKVAEVIIHALSATIELIDKIITGLRLIAGFVIGQGSRLFGNSAEEAEKLKLSIGGVSIEANKAKESLTAAGQAGTTAFQGASQQATAYADALRQVGGNAQNAADYLRAIAEQGRTGGQMGAEGMRIWQNALAHVQRRRAEGVGLSGQARRDRRPDECRGSGVQRVVGGAANGWRQRAARC